MKNDIRELPLTAIWPNPDQPRKVFSTEPLAELAANIKANGLLQPIVVTHRKGPEGQAFMIVAGERRWRASQLAGLTKITAIVRDLTRKTTKELALLENLLRQDLDPMEEARAYSSMLEDGYTPETLSEILGYKNTKRVTDRVALLSLDFRLQDALQKNIISVAQAGLMTRLTVEGQFKVFRAIQDGCESQDKLRRIALAVYNLENQRSLFRSELTENEKTSLSKVDSFIGQVERLVGMLSEDDMVVLRSVQKSDAPLAIEKITQLQKTLNFLKGTLTTSVAKAEVTAG